MKPVSKLHPTICITPRQVWAFVLFVCFVLILLSQHSAWSYHLRSDTDGFYFPRALYFWEHGNLTQLGYNEYQPGAMLFFLSLSPAFLISKSVEVYRSSLFALNTGLILATAYVLHRFVHTKAVLLFSLICLFTGPVILHRFELYLGLCLMASVLCMYRGHPATSLFFLGWAFMIKIFPILLLPYYFIHVLHKYGVKHSIRGLVSFGFGAGVVVAAYCLIGQITPKQLIADVSIHAQKPVHAESVWATSIGYAHRLVHGEYPKGRGDKGIYGVDPSFVPLSLEFYNYFWIIPVGLWYGLIVLTQQYKTFNLWVILTTTGVFLVFSKILTCQYLLWIGLLMPMLYSQESAASTESKIDKIGFYFLIMTFIAQVIYPLFYNELLAGFYENGSSGWLFWLLAVRNLCLVVITIKLAQQALHSHHSHVLVD